jgi:hypothetical protein
MTHHTAEHRSQSMSDCIDNCTTRESVTKRKVGA